jgi:hypothetical protein
MKLDRRDFFKFVGGSAVGLAFTPVPWTLLDDTAKWSQNWSWIPRPPKGEIRTKFTTCTLCPAGCGVKARCVGDQPVSLAGVTAHPASRGALCPIGLAGHHQPYHPLRLRHALRHGRPLSVEEAVPRVRDAIAGSLGKGQVAVWDSDPGRARSVISRRFAAQIENGMYLSSPPPEGAMLRVLENMFEKPSGPLGLDLENTRTILSFGAPVLDGWGTPGRVLKQRANFRLVQVEAELSRTASLADSWLQIRLGTDTTLALALAHVWTRQSLVDPASARKATDYRAYLELTAQYTPEYAAGICGIPAGKIIETAREMAKGEPALVIAESPSGPIAGLNLLFGGAGRAIVKRGGPAPQPAPSTEDAENGSICVLIATGAVPWERFEKKLAPGAVVVRLSPWNDARAEYVIPTPVYLESTVDVPATFDARTDMLSVAAPLVAPPAGVIDPSDFLARLDPSLGKPDDAIVARIAAVYKTRRGSVLSYKDGAPQPLAEFESAEALRKALLAGAVWLDAPRADQDFPRFSLTGDSPAATVNSRNGWRAVPGLSVSPILSKLCQESGLRDRGEA